MRLIFTPPYRYIIDTCSILSQKADESHRRNVYSSLWNKIDDLIMKQEITICSEIKLEVEDDDIQKWLINLNCAVINVDKEIEGNVIRIVNEHPELLSFADVKSSGDVFLIATAMKYNLSVITEENKRSPKKNTQNMRML